MKNNTKKIMQYSVLAFAAAAVLPMACKKEAAEADDPEIDFIAPNIVLNGAAGEYRSLDTTITIGASSIDFLIDVQNASDKYKYAYLDFDGDTYAQNSDSRPVNDENWRFFQFLGKGTAIDTAASVWNDGEDDGYFFVNDKDPAPGDSYGINGQGDKYIAFRKEISAANYKYGWIKVNVSADANTVTVKEIGLSNVNNKVIKVGAK